MKLLKGDANAAIRRGSLAGMLEHSNDDDAERSNHDHDSEAKHETRMASRAKRSRRRRKAERDAELDVESLVRRRREARRVAADHLSKGMPDSPVLQQRSADRSAGDADLSSGAISASLDFGDLSSISKREGEKDETDDEDELPLTIPTEYPDHDGASFKTSSDERRLRARRRLAAAKEKLELSGKQIAPQSRTAAPPRASKRGTSSMQKKSSARLARSSKTPKSLAKSSSSRRKVTNYNALKKASNRR